MSLQMNKVVKKKKVLYDLICEKEYQAFLNLWNNSGTINASIN